MSNNASELGPESKIVISTSWVQDFYRYYTSWVPDFLLVNIIL